MVIDAVLRPVRSGNVYEDTVERLLQAVKLGIVPRGARLPPERHLAVRLGVSRETLRSAINVLQEEGYLESRRGRYGGTFVTYQPAAQRPRRGIPHEVRGSIGDILTLRSVLEPGAAAVAASRDLGPQARADLRARLDGVMNAAPADYRQADSWLHLTLAELAGSPSLLVAVADERVRVNELLDAIPLLPPNIDHSNDQHAAVVDAVLAGKPEQARQAMAEHLDGTAALLRGFLG
jgi:DNA-binding FadR family transcriptional regulator